MIIRGFIQNTRVTKEPLGKYEDQNNENEINTQNKYINEMDSDSVKGKHKTLPSEANEDI